MSIQLYLPEEIQQQIEETKELLEKLQEKHKLLAENNISIKLNVYENKQVKRVHVYDFNMASFETTFSLH